MKLKEFNVDNTYTLRTKAYSPALRIYKRGVIHLNGEACNLIGLTIDDQIIAHQDQEDPQNWYLEKVKSKGFRLRSLKANGGFVFNSRQLVKNISESIDFTGKSGRMLIAGKPTKIDKRILWGIITISIITKS